MYTCASLRVPSTLDLKKCIFEKKAFKVLRAEADCWSCRTFRHYSVLNKEIKFALFYQLNNIFSAPKFTLNWKNFRLLENPILYSPLKQHPPTHYLALKNASKRLKFKPLKFSVYFKSNAHFSSLIAFIGHFSFLKLFSRLFEYPEYISYIHAYIHT